LLGLYELGKGRGALVWDLAFYAAIALLPMLAAAIIVRLMRERPVSTIEVALTMSAWGLFLYNVSFVRG
jgi:hypothetical protein